MIHVSPSPVEVGVFDAEESLAVAREIVQGQIAATATQNSGRLVMNHTADIVETLDRIELLTVNDMTTHKQKLRPRLYAQNFAEINEDLFPGIVWHIDVAGQSPINSDPMDFYFGSSSHTTEFFVGSLDLTDVHRQLTTKHKDSFVEFPELPALMLRWAPEDTLVAIQDAVEKGDGHIMHADSGVLYKVEKGTVHRMQPFDRDMVYPARFCIEQYL